MSAPFNDLFLRAFTDETLERFPVWLMRQAGRYQPSYQALRKKHSLLDMFTNPELAARVTLLPVEELQVDAAIIFSDILLILNSLGLDVVFPEGEGPRCTHPIQSKGDVEKLFLGEVKERIGYVGEAIKLVKPKLNIPLIGFAGGPFTVATYALRNAAKFCKEEETAFAKLIDLITEQTIAYLKMQQEAGVNCVQIFDSWANLLEGEAFERYSLNPFRKITAALPSLKVIYFSRGSSHRAKEIAAAKPGAISFDSDKPLYLLQKEVSIPIQGNFDPKLLLGDLKILEAEVKSTLHQLERKKVIINLGHGVLKETPYEHVKEFVQLAKEGTRKPPR